jgi:50S ribosomal protein L16 3-hydroxylase
MWRLEGIDPADFIDRYWQKKPCLIRNAFAGFESPVSPEELAGLACEEGVHSRLVVENADGKPWQVRYGPFEERNFLDLPESNYSLLVSECEKWLPELAVLLDQFRFLPDWRIDDLMLSYAPEGGSVGPHVDEYDVFLLQAMGRRRWQYGERRCEDTRLVPNLELAILRDFDPRREAVLEPGDMLYLPPGIAHHGVALERCLTYSIGFRAPDAVSTLESFALEIERIGSNLPRYTDSDLELDRHHAEITDAEIARFRALAVDFLEQSPALWRDAVGKMLSDSSAAREDGADQPIYVSDLQANDWIRHPETRLFYHESAETIEVYYNGNLHELPRRDDILERLQELCGLREWPAALISRCLQFEALEKMLLEIAENGAILPLTDENM